MFGNSIMPIINKLTRVTKSTGTVYRSLYIELCYHNQISNRNYKIGYLGIIFRYFLWQSTIFIL